MSLRASRIAVAAGFFVAGCVLGNWVSRIPWLQHHLNLSTGPLGVALLGAAFGAMFAMPLTGWLLGRFRSEKICTISGILYALSLPLPLFATSAETLFVILFFMGAATGALDVSMNVQAVEVEKAYGRPIMSSFHALFSIGGMVGAFGGGALAAAGLGVWPHFLLAAVALSAVMIAANRYLFQTEPHDGPEGRLALPEWALLGPATIALCIMCSEGAMADWTAVYLRDSLTAGPVLASAGYAVFSLCMAIGRLVGDRVVYRFGNVNVMRAGSALAALGIGSAVLVPRAETALLGFGLAGFGYSCLVPIVFSAAGRSRRTNPGTALAAVTMSGYVGLMAGPPVIGFAAEVLTLRGALVILVGLSLVATMLARTVSAGE